MTHRGRIALFALFFAGLVGLWAADRLGVPTRLDRDRARGRILVDLIDARPDDLRRIEIAGGDRPIVFERRERTSWQMTAPIDVAADPSKVEALALQLKGLARKPEAATLAGDPADYGLAPPSRTVTFWGKGDRPLAALELGKVSLGRRYVRPVGSGGIEVVDAAGLDLAELAPIAWRDRELFRVPSFEVDAVKLSGPGVRLDFARRADGWRVDAPFRALARDEKVEGLIADLGSLRVTDDARFAFDGAGDADFARFGLDKPALTIEVGAGRGADRPRPKQVLHVGKPVEGKPELVYARRDDQNDVVIVEGRSLAGLGTDPNSYRSPKVADIRPGRAIRVEVTAGGGTFEIDRRGADWVIARPEVARTDRQAIQAFWKGIDGLQTEIYLDPKGPAAADTGLDRPQIRLKIWEAGGNMAKAEPGSAAGAEPDFVLDVGRRDAGRKVVYGRVGGDSTILALPDAALDFLPRSVLAFRDHLVLALRVERLERIALSGPGRSIALNAPVLAFDPTRTGPIGWWMVEPVASPADPAAMGRLLKMLANLRAESLVADPADDAALARFGLKSPAQSLTWSAFAAPDPSASAAGTAAKPGPPKLEEHGLRIGLPVPGRPNARYAKLDEGPLVFVMPAEAMAVLGLEYHDHRPLALDPASIRRVGLAWRDRSISLAAGPGSGAAWSIEGAVDAPGLRPEAVPALVRASASLSTEKYFQYDGPLPPSTGLEPPVLTIRFAPADPSAPPRVLKLGHPAPRGERFASVGDGPTGPVFLVPDAPFAEWTRAPRRPGDLPEDVFTPDPSR